MNSVASGTTIASTDRLTFPVRVSSNSRALGFVELTKPRIATMALVAVTVGYTLASRGNWMVHPFLHALAGISLVAFASSTLNQVIERQTDRRMARTKNRPIPSGRISANEALLFGVACAVVGLIWLAAMVNVTTCLLAAATMALYVGAYTPLKPATSLCTTIGAIPGALPPVLGWTAAGGSIDLSAFTLFAILFVWQFPHFLAIAWIYRQQYGEAKLKMLPANGHGPIVGMMAVGYASVLIPVSLLPTEYALGGRVYALTAVLLGIGYLCCAIRFFQRQTYAAARELLFSSLVYLPLLLLALCWDYLRLLNTSII